MTKSDDDNKTSVSITDTIHNEVLAVLDSNKIDSAAPKEIKKKEKINDSLRIKSDDWTGTREVKLKLNEFKVTDNLFYSLLDSIVKREKKCMNSNLNALHWKLFELKENVFHLTMGSDIGKAKYEGYFMIDNMIFLTTKDIPNKLERTERIEKFKFKNKNFPYPEDYSTYFFANVNGQMKIVKSYTIPCD